MSVVLVLYLHSLIHTFINFVRDHIAGIAGIADIAVMSVDFVGHPSMFNPFIPFVRAHVAGIADIAVMSVVYQNIISLVKYH